MWSLVSDNANNIAHLASTKFYVINDVLWILLWVHNKTISFNSGVLAYKVNSLMMMVATTKTCWNREWLCDILIDILFAFHRSTCVYNFKTLESLSVWCILLEIFRKIIMNKSHTKISHSNKLLTENTS
jgi:hypothetical protein